MTLFVVASCSGPTPKPEPSTSTLPATDITAEQPAAVPIVEDNVRHDTLLVQVTFDLQDGTHLMVAGNVEENFEGLRLYRYRARPDSSAQIIAVSAPGYDSWTMLPTFFDVRDMPDRRLILANFGERQSWGQKLMVMNDTNFMDLGFIDAAFPERVSEEDTTYLKRTNLGPYARMGMTLDTAVFTFACDSVFLYDDLNGRTDVIVPASDLRFTHHPAIGLEMWYKGERRKVLPPS